MEDKINVTRSLMPPFEEYTEEIKDLWESGWLTNMGVKHQALEKRLLDYLEVDHITLFTNGHLALEAVIDAFDLSGEVITTPFTFASTTTAIVRRGLTPVFCDINYEDYTMDASKIEELITDQTSAIMPVHVYGNLCDVEEIERIAEKHDLKVIYDAAHTFGEDLNGVGVGQFGDASMFSFHATKVFNTIEGGGISYSDPALAEKLDAYKNFGKVSEDVYDYPGGNAKMNEFQAAMGLTNLKHVDEEIAKRKKVYERYMRNLDGIEGLKLPYIQEGLASNYAYFPVVFEDFEKTRDEVFDLMAENKISTRKYFYPLMNKLEFFEGKYDSLSLPTAEFVSENVLTLPLYADLDLKTVDYICDCIVKQRSAH